MLDSYYCKDSDNTPESPKEENYIGSFELKYFKLLQEVVDYAKDVGIRMHFFEDFRLLNKDIGKLLKFSESTLSNVDANEVSKKDAYKRMIAILKAAKAKEVGIMFFCD